MSTIHRASSGNAQAGAKLRSSCDNCASAKVKCGREGPACSRCKLLSLSCHYGPSRRNGKKPRKPVTPTQHHIEERKYDASHMQEMAHSLGFGVSQTGLAPREAEVSARGIDRSLGTVDFEENDLPTHFYAPLPFDQFGAWPLGGFGMDMNFFPDPQATAITATSVTGDVHSCPRESYEIFRDLICPSPFLHAPESNSATVSAPLDQVLQFNKAAIDRLTKVLKCPCSRSGHRAMVNASIVSRILIWYQQAAGLAGSSPSVSRKPALAQPLASLTSSAPQRPPSAPEAGLLSLSQMTGFTVDQVPLSYGAFEVEDENMQVAFRNQLVLSELKKVAGLIETFVTQTSEDDGGSLYVHLGTWLQGEYSRTLDILASRLQSFSNGARS